MGLPALLWQGAVEKYLLIIRQWGKKARKRKKGWKVRGDVMFSSSWVGGVCALRVIPGKKGGTKGGGGGGSRRATCGGGGVKPLDLGARQVGIQ